MAKDILILANYGPTPGTKSNDRIITLLDLLITEGYNVELVSTSFQHSKKEQKKIDDKVLEDLPYKYTMVYEPGYPKNVSLKRFYSHHVAAKNLTKYLNDRKKPDLIFAVTTSTAFGYAAAMYAKKNNIKLVIDVRDIWPEVFKLVIKNDLIADMLFYGQKKKADAIYAQADGIVGVSQTYVDRALSVNKKVKEGLAVFLGTELNKFDKFIDKEKSLKPEEELWVVYIGTLGHSYNINDVIDAFKILKEKGLTNIKFKVLGDGPLMDSFIERARNKDIECEFLGRLPYPDMVKYITNCDIAINPIVDSSSASIINKVADYAAAGLPLINTQPSKEFKKLLMDYNAGYNCNNGDIKDIAEKIENLCKDEKLREAMGANNRKLAMEKFDRNKTYPKIITLINEILNKEV
ncbi:MAG: glycosyltransferase family 4 protein [Christensenellales bacterium]|jgi:glycosyltransferase involved in cell wall biosynthesis